MPHTSPLICDDVSVTYPNGFSPVTRFSLTVGPGEIVALLGPSGSGKSTLLRGIAGLERISSGRITMSGEVVDAAETNHHTPHQHVPTHRRGCGMVFQDGQLFPHRSVGRNISYGLEVQKVPATERRRRVDQLLELIDLAGYADRPVATLSGGQAQRVALARSLAPEPPLLLLDEPLSALDRPLRERLSVEIRRILTETSTAAVYVTHDHAEADTTADRVITLAATV